MNLNNSPENFYAGKIKLFSDRWQQITSDEWIINSVQGVTLDFHIQPSQHYIPRAIRFDKNEEIILNAEIERLVHCGVIEPTVHSQGEYISNIFMRQKKDGSFRIILNLKSLNDHLEYHHFKMETLKNAINLMTKDCFFCSIDLKDAYFSCPIADADRIFLRFLWHGQLYQFTCLAQGLSPAPRIFTKIMKPVFSELRKQGYTSVTYIDDTLLLEATATECTDNMQTTAVLFDELGFTIQTVKSIFEPTQIIEFLGFILNSITMTVSLTMRKASKIRQLCQTTIHKKWISIRDFAALIGNLVASEPGVMYAPLFYKRLENEKNCALSDNRGDFDAQMALTDIMREDLQWWIDNIQHASKPVYQRKITVVLHSDASKKGWGGTCGVHSTGGQWTPAETQYHINYLELLAIFLTLQCFCREMRKVHIRVMSDNTTAVTCN